ncbi:Hypothetical protein A7982_04003 [Minicystis rosea]|nr:Hypothetical protein A7982_04003 [Minicystis rosea]
MAVAFVTTRTRILAHDRDASVLFRSSVAATSSRARARRAHRREA